MEYCISGIFLPLFIFFLLGGFGRFIGRKGAVFVALIGMGFAVFKFFKFGYLSFLAGESQLVFMHSWLFDTVDWGFLLDSISLQMCFLISSITFCVILYAAEYMFHDPHVIRFLSFLALFAFFMLILVTANNLVQMFIGWEGVGFVSFLLINFWFMRLEANRSALKAMLFNRIGDSFYLLGMIFCFFLLRTTDLVILTNLINLFNLDTTFMNLSEMFYLVFGLFEVHPISILIFCFFLAAVGKSAQLGLQAWLPDAMEGPTPVSSLLHSATMVTAGVFLLIRLSPLFCNLLIFKFIILIGALTAALNAIFGFFQNDLKKIIAFSTCSQLGIMVVGVVYNSNVGFYHLVNHGYFKALLFLSAGSIIHALHNEQDIRKMGGLLLFMPFTQICFLIGSLALMGMPFLSGFYSKEFILFNLFSSNLIFDRIIFCLIFLASIFTVLYSLKIIRSVFFCNLFKNTKKVLLSVHEPGFNMLCSMSILAFLSLSFGFFHEDVFNLLGTSLWYNTLGHFSLNSLNYVNLFFKTEMFGFGFKLFFLFFSLFLIWSFYVDVFQKKKKQNHFLFDFFSSQFPICYKFWLICFWSFSNKLGFISLYRKLTMNFLYVGYHVIFLLIDRGLLELLGPTLVIRIFHSVHRRHSQIFVLLVNMFLIFGFFFLIGILGLFIKFCFLFFFAIMVFYLYFNFSE